MTDADDFHTQVASLFDAVANLSAEDRRAYLSARDIPADVLAELQSLLGHDVRSIFTEEQLGMIAPPLVDRTTGNAVEWSAGHTVGDYRIEREIARGGMGVVFEATQISLGRKVALKVVRSSHLATDEELQRFRLEAESVARLDHPGIVPVHEVGELDGELFFSMGYVGGGSLAELPLPIGEREAARIVQQVADAVHYANSRNVVHRDLKPANVLLGEDGKPKISDFGLAKKTDEASDLTVTGSVMGTPGFMAPEQAQGDRDLVGPPADVYGIGAILYYLLVGRAPIRGAHLMDTLQRIQTETPPSPDKVRTELSRDISSICMRCLEKHPAQRYASAAEVANELQRFRNHETVLARPVGPLGRAGRFCRRSPVLAGLGILAIALSLTVAIGSLVFAWQLSEREQRIKTARDDAIDAKVEAEVILQFMVDDVLGLVGPKNSVRLGFDASVRDTVLLAEKSISQRFAGRPGAEAFTRMRFGQILRYVGEYERATACLELGQAAARRAGDAELELQMVQQQAIIWFNRDRYDLAEPLYEQAAAAIATLRANTPTDDTAKLAELRAIEVQLWHDLGILYATTDRSERARELFDRVVEHGRLGLRMSAKNQLTGILRRLERFDEAVAAAEQLYEACLRELPVDHEETVSAQLELGITLRHAGRLDEAVEVLRQAVATHIRIFRLDNRWTMLAHEELAIAWMTQSRFDEAVALLEPLLPTIDAALRENPGLGWQLKSSLGRSLAAVGRANEGISLLEGALAYWRTCSRFRRDARWTALIHLLQLYASNNRIDDAVAMCDAEIESVGDDPQWTHISALLTKALEQLQRRRRTADLEPVLDRALEHARRVHGAGLELSSLIATRANAFYYVGRSDLMVALLEREQDALEAIRATLPRRYWRLKRQLGVGLWNIKQPAKAVEVFRVELAHRIGHEGEGAADTIRARENLAMNLAASGAVDEGVEQLRIALPHAENGGEATANFVPSIHEQLRRLLTGKGELEAALPHWQFLIDFHERNGRAKRAAQYRAALQRARDAR